MGRTHSGIQGRFRDLPWIWWVLAGAYPTLGITFAITLARAMAGQEMEGLPQTIAGLAVIASGLGAIGVSVLLGARARLDCIRYPHVEVAEWGVLLRAGTLPDTYLSSAVGWFGGALILGGIVLVTSADDSHPRSDLPVSFVLNIMGQMGVVFMLVWVGVLLWLRSRRRVFPGDVVLSVEGVSQRVGDAVWEVAWADIVRAAGARKSARGDVVLVYRVVSGPVCRGWGCWWRRWGGVRARDFRLLVSPLSFSVSPWDALVALAFSPGWEEFITGPDAVERVRALFEAESFEDRVWPSYTPFENRGRYMRDLKKLP